MANGQHAGAAGKIVLLQVSQFARPSTWAAQRLRSIPGLDRPGGRNCLDPSQDPGSAESTSRW